MAATMGVEVAVDMNMTVESAAGAAIGAPIPARHLQPPMPGWLLMKRSDERKRPRNWQQSRRRKRISWQSMDKRVEETGSVNLCNIFKAIEARVRRTWKRKDGLFYYCVLQTIIADSSLHLHVDM